jgi:hypothetical protein
MGDRAERREERRVAGEELNYLYIFHINMGYLKTKDPRILDKIDEMHECHTLFFQVQKEIACQEVISN